VVRALRTVRVDREVLASLVERRCRGGQGCLPLRALPGVLVGQGGLAVPVGKVCTEAALSGRRGQVVVCLGFRGFLERRAFRVVQACLAVPGVLAVQASSSLRS